MTNVEKLTVARVLEFVKDRRREDVTLEFKRAPKVFSDKDERKLLAKAISGFANSSGGAVVWGIDARPDPEGIDCAQSAHPIGDGALFMAKLSEFGDAATFPPVTGIRHHLIDDEPGGPFAVTVVPESDLGPHMAKLGEDRYYKRSGGRFYRMEHFDVADMFGRRRVAKLHVSARVLPGQPGKAVVALRNIGRGPAIAPYLALHLPGRVTLSERGMDGMGRWTLARLPLPPDAQHAVAFGGDASLVLHPNVEIAVAILDVREPGISEFDVIYEVATDGVPLTAGTIRVQKDPGGFVR